MALYIWPYLVKSNIIYVNYKVNGKPSKNPRIFLDAKNLGF